MDIVIIVIALIVWIAKRAVKNPPPKRGGLSPQGNDLRTPAPRSSSPWASVRPSSGRPGGSWAEVLGLPADSSGKATLEELARHLGMTEEKREAPKAAPAPPAPPPTPPPALQPHMDARDYQPALTTYTPLGSMAGQDTLIAAEYARDGHVPFGSLAEDPAFAMEGAFGTEGVDDCHDYMLTGSMAEEEAHAPLPALRFGASELMRGVVYAEILTRRAPRRRNAR